MANEKRYFKFKNSENSVFESDEVVDDGPFEDWDEISKKEYDAHSQIFVLKKEIARTDYIACKLAEAETEQQRTALRQEYATQLARRAEIRAQINELEESL